jgi:hypothetical protein
VSPQSAASLHSLLFLDSCRSSISIAIIFHGVSSSVIIYTNRRFRFASVEESFAIMEMSTVRQPASDILATKKHIASWYRYPPPLTRLQSSLKCTKDYIALYEEKGNKCPDCLKIETASSIINVIITNFVGMFVNNILTKYKSCFVKVFKTFKTN